MVALIIPAILFLAEKNANNPKYANQVCPEVANEFAAELSGFA
jgi:hypothetical protein